VLVSIAQVPLASGGVDLRLLHYEVLPPRTVQARAGDWDCAACAARNFAGRHVCFKCGAPAPEAGLAAANSRGNADATASVTRSTSSSATSAARTAAPTHAPAAAALRPATRAPQDPVPQLWSSSPWTEAAAVPLAATASGTSALTAAATPAPPPGFLSPAAVAALTVPELKAALKARQLPVSGLKRDLAERLLLNLR
jgi:hypothetical protein